MTEKSLPETGFPAEFSICRGGPTYDLARSLGLPGGISGLVRLGVALALLTWIPLVALSIFEGVLHQGPRIPFWQSIGTHVRLLLAIPLFFFGRVRVRCAGSRRPAPDAPNRVGAAAR